MFDAKSLGSRNRREVSSLLGKGVLGLYDAAIMANGTIRRTTCTVTRHMTAELQALYTSKVVPGMKARRALLDAVHERHLGFEDAHHAACRGSWGEALYAMASIPGLGPAKAAFALQIALPDCPLWCLDSRNASAMGLQPPQRVGVYYQTLMDLDKDSDTVWGAWCIGVGMDSSSRLTVADVLHAHKEWAVISRAIRDALHRGYKPLHPA